MNPKGFFAVLLCEEPFGFTSSPCPNPRNTGSSHSRFFNRHTHRSTLERLRWGWWVGGWWVGGGGWLAGSGGDGAGWGPLGNGVWLGVLVGGLVGGWVGGMVVPVCFLTHSGTGRGGRLISTPSSIQVQTELLVFSSDSTFDSNGSLRSRPFSVLPLLWRPLGCGAHNFGTNQETGGIVLTSPVPWFAPKLWTPQAVTTPETGMWMVVCPCGHVFLQ